MNTQEAEQRVFTLEKELFEAYNNILYGKMRWYQSRGHINSIEFENMFVMMKRFGTPNEELQKFMDELVIIIVHDS